MTFLIVVVVVLYLSLSFTTYGIVELGHDNPPAWLRVLAAICPLFVVLWLFVLAVVFYTYRIKTSLFGRRGKA